MMGPKRLRTPAMGADVIGWLCCSADLRGGGFYRDRAEERTSLRGPLFSGTAPDPADEDRLLTTLDALLLDTGGGRGE